MRGRSRGSLALLFNPFGDSAVDLLPGSSEPHSGRQTSSSADERHVWTVTDREKKSLRKRRRLFAVGSRILWINALEDTHTGAPCFHGIIV